MPALLDRPAIIPAAQARGEKAYAFEGKPKKIASSVGNPIVRITTGPGLVTRVDRHFVCPALFPEESLDFQAEKPEETLQESLAAYAAMAASLPKQEFDEDFDLPYL